MAHRTMVSWRATLPREPSTRSYWHSELDREISDSNSTSPLPLRTDYAIIGSGLSGALIAFDLIRTLPIGTTITILEARHATSGATGRNGGHIKPGRLGEYLYLKEKYGTKLAIAQLAFEKGNFDDLTRFIKDHNLDEECALVILRAVDACMNEKGHELIKSSWEQLQKDGGDVSDMEYHDAAATAKGYRLPNAYSSVSYPAASLWPYKLTIAILKLAIKRGVQLYTQVPVHTVDRTDDQESWALTTSKGVLKATNVIHATNGYASYLLPELTDKLVPCKGHAAAAEPPQNFFNSPLETTFAFHWGEDFDYLIQRHHDTKPLIYGGCDLSGTGDPEFYAGDSDDATINPLVADALRRLPGENFKDWTRGAGGDGFTKTQVWSGIMGFVVDDFPYVGAVPGKKGQFICGGYTGRGMARAFLCTQALGQLIRGDEVDSRVPPQYMQLERRWGKRETLSGVLGRPYPSL